MATTVDIKKKISDAKFTIKTINEKLPRLRNELRNYSSAKNLTAAQIAAAKKLNKQISDEESKKNAAQKTLDQFEPKISDLEEIESIDSQIKAEVDAYVRNKNLGGKPNRSRINALLNKRSGLAKNLGTLAPKAPSLARIEQAPVTTSAGPTGSVTLQATKTADQTAKDEADAALGKRTPGGKGKGAGADVQGVMPTMPTGGGTAVAGPGFNPAVVRAGEEASMGATPNIPPKSQRDLESILRQTEFWYDLPDYIFKTVPKLGELLVKAVNEGWEEERFLSQAKLTDWWQQNSAPIRTRIIARAKFNEIQGSGQDASKTEYAMDTATIKRSVQARARQMGANLDENAINQVVARIYDGFLENDTTAIDSFIAPYIGKVSSIVGTGIGMQPSGYTGQALQNFQALQAVAKANGLTIKDILPKFSVLPGQSIDDVVLQKLATGELDINRLAQDARMIAAQGTPDYVKGLLQQGYDLEQIYSPYKNVMAQILELNPDQIDLNDGTLRGAIGMDKEMNIYDFKKALRRDPRWQYTQNARDDMSSTALNLLRNFGFQG